MPALPVPISRVDGFVPFNLLRCVLVALCLLAVDTRSGAVAVEIPDLRDIAKQNHELAGLRDDIVQRQARSEALTEALAAQLADEERTLDTRDVTPALLREARLDLDTQRARLVVIEGRLDQRRLSLERLDAMLDSLAPEVQRDGLRATEELRLEAAHDLLTLQAQLTMDIIHSYDVLIGTARRNGSLLEQRLRLLQSRIRLDSIAGKGLFEEDYRIPLLESVIADHLRRAIEISNRLDGVKGNDADAQARRRTLNVRLDDSVMRSFLRQNDLELIRTEQALDDLKALREDDLMPLHVLTDAEQRLGSIAAGLVQIDESLEAQRGVLESRRGAIQRHSGAEAPDMALIEDLEQLIGFQQVDIDALRARVETERTTFERVIGDSQTSALFAHRPLPATAQDWRRLGQNGLRIPVLLGAAWRSLQSDLGAHIGSAPLRIHAFAIAGGLGLALATVWGRRRLLALDDAQPEASPLTLFQRPLATMLPTLIPAAVWLLMGLIYGVDGATFWPPFLLLMLAPVLALVLGLARSILYLREPEDEVEDARDRFYGKLRLGLMLATLVAALYIMTHALPVAPILADLVDRMAMLAVLALALPAFALRELLLWLGRRGPFRLRPRMAWLAWVSRAIPIFLLVTGGVGLAGFTELAWTVLTYLAWTLVVGLLLFLAIGVLLDLRERIGERVAGSGELGDFWRTHFVEPGYRLGVLLTAVAGAWLLFGLWGWNMQTPIVRGFVAIIETPLFKLGDSAFAVSDILLALVLVAGAFYIGGWSHQVSYNLAYRRVRDAGLRQALATLTHYVVLVAGVLLVLRIIGFDLTTLTVFAASLGVGIGFGLQNIINNFVSGILLLAERPLKVGDFVSIGSNLGNVTRIGIRSLTIRTLDKQEVIIPNGSVISGEFTNWTRSDDVLRHVLYVGIRYGDDAELALDLIRQVLDEHPHILDDPEPGVFLWEYAESAVNIRIQYCFSMNDGPGGLVIRSDVLLAIARRFKAQGIAIPFPQRDVTLHLGDDSRAALAGLGSAPCDDLLDHTGGRGVSRVEGRSDPRLQPPADTGG